MPDAAVIAVPDAPMRTRRCIATGKVGDRAAMLRFVAGPDASIVPDVAGRLPGRGVWVSAEAAALRLACRRGLFSRALKAPVNVSGDLIEQVERLLRRRCIELLGLANRAGEVVFGFEKCQGWLAAGRGALLLAATGGSARELARLCGTARDLPVIRCLTGEEMGRAAGRDHVTYGLVSRGRIADKLAAEAARLAGIQPAGDCGSEDGDPTTLSAG